MRVLIPSPPYPLPSNKKNVSTFIRKFMDIRFYLYFMLFVNYSRILDLMLRTRMGQKCVKLFKCLKIHFMTFNNNLWCPELCNKSKRQVGPPNSFWSGTRNVVEEFAKTPPPPINLTLSAEMDGWDGDQCHQITNLSKNVSLWREQPHRSGVIKWMLEIPCAIDTLWTECSRINHLFSFVWWFSVFPGSMASQLAVWWLVAVWGEQETDE